MDVAKSSRATSNDLWTTAINTLEDELLLSLTNLGEETKQDALNQLLAATIEAKQSLDERLWSFKRWDGKKVIVRDVLTKMAKWVNHFKEIGDIAVQYDPVHAALPWAGIRFLLNVAVGDLNTYAQLLERTTEIAEIICRNALVERLLSQNQSDGAEELRRALVKLYACILVYLTKARSYYLQNTLKRALKHGFVASSDFQSSSKSITEAQGDVDRCFTVFGLQTHLETNSELQRMLKDLDAPVVRWSEALNEIKDRLDVTQREKILSWISDEPYRQHHIQAHSEVLQGTGTWLLQNNAFLSWKNESASSVLWLHGIPGSGKSKLSSIVINDAIGAFNRHQAPGPVYFYCSRNPAEPGRSDPSRIIASIARQLSAPQSGGPLLDAAVDMYSQREKEAFASGPLSLEESRELVLRLLEQYKNATVTMVVDALDECNAATRGTLLETLKAFLAFSPCLLKIFVSSRNDQDIAFNLNDYPDIVMSSNHNAVDIDLFVRSETNRLIENGSLLRSSSRKDELRNQIIHKLTSDAHGMFRWASLQLQTLQRFATDGAVTERLGRLPGTLAQLYQEILSNIENYEAESDKQLTWNALSWLLCGQEQLAAAMFLTAVSMRRDKAVSAVTTEQLLYLCCNLVVFDAHVDVFRFSHLSVREFLEDSDTFKSALTNAFVAESCLLHIMSSSSESMESTALFDYACFFWAQHAQAAQEQRQTQFKETLLNFLWLNPTAGFYRWHTKAERMVTDSKWGGETSEKIKDSMSFTPSCLLVVCAHDLSGVFDLNEWKKMTRASPTNKRALTPEEIAAKYNSWRILEWLFHIGVPFEASNRVILAAADATPAKDDSGGEFMALLLDKHQAEINITEEVVTVAAANLSCPGEVLSILLDKCGTDIHITEEIVKAAASNLWKGREGMTVLLAKRGSEFQITEEIIKAAAESWEHGRKMMERGFRIGDEETQKAKYDSAWSRNWNSGRDVMALLVDQREAEIRITEEVLKIILRILDASWIRRHLENHAADIKITEDVVAAAAANWYSGRELIALLLDKYGPEIRITEEIVIAAAANWYSGRAVMALLLEECGAEIRITEEIVIAAAANGNSGREVMALLLEKRGTEIYITEEIVIAAVANCQGGREVTALLLDKRGAEIQITEEVISAAAANQKSGREVIALLLDKRGAEIQITEEVLKIILRILDASWIRRHLENHAADIQITEEVVAAAAANWYSGREVMALLLEKHGPEIWITEEVVIAAAANGDSGREVMALLLDKRGAEIQITEEIAMAAAANWYSGREVMALLLDKRGTEIRITEEIVIAAAANGNSGREVMALLLERRGAEIRITEEIVIAAAANGNSGGEVMALLLEKRGAEIQITEVVIMATDVNSMTGMEVMALLLDKRGAEIQFTKEVLQIIMKILDASSIRRLLENHAADINITQEVVAAAAANKGNGRAVMALLLDRRGPEIRITKEVLKAAAANSDSGRAIMALLLDKRGAEIRITEEVVKAAAENWNSGGEVMALLLDKRGAEIKMTEELVTAAAANLSSGGELMALLLDKRGTEIQITEEVIKTAAANEWSGREVMALLLDKRGTEIQITEEVIIAAAANGDSGRAVMALLLDKRGAEIRITEEVVVAAATNGDSGREVMALLLDKRREEIQITEEVVVAAATNGDSGRAVMVLLLDKCVADIQITERVLRIIVRVLDPSSIRRLLEEYAADIHITEGVIVAAAANLGSGRAVMALLLDKCGGEIKITNEILIASAANRNSGKQVMTLLLDERGGGINITEEVLIAAAANWNGGREVIELVLDKCGADIRITEEVFRNIIMTLDVFLIKRLLENHAADIKITEEIVIAAAANWYSGRAVMALLLDKRGTEILITEEVVVAAATNWYSGRAVMALLLDKRGAEIQITKEVVIAAAANGNSGRAVMALLLDKRGVEIQITEEVVIAAAANGDSGREVMALLLDKRGAEFQITQEVIMAAAANIRRSTEVIMGMGLRVPGHVDLSLSGNWDNGWEVMALLLDKRGAEIRITEEVVIAAAANRDKGRQVMALLLDKRGAEIRITEEVVIAAAANGNSGRAVMALLLDKRGAEIRITEAVLETVVASPACKRVVDLLLNLRESEMIDSITPKTFLTASKNGNEDIVCILLDAQATVQRGSIYVWLLSWKIHFLFFGGVLLLNFVWFYL